MAIIRTMVMTLFILVMIIILTLWFINGYFHISLPDYQPVNEVQQLDQNWTAEQRQWFYHTPQGTLVMPYQWFLALEQPQISLFSAVPLFRADDYLGRFGFIPNSKHKYNPDGLPIGFTKNDRFVDPMTQEAMTVAGLTCAACHTGQMNYKGVGVRVDGAPAMTNVNKFQKALGNALFLTYYDPFKFDRFAKRVLGENYNADNKDKLQQKLKQALDQGKAEEKLNQERHLYPTEEGFSRLDALGRIGNFVFGTELNNDNLRVVNAPVNFPQLWDTSWLDWVQFNGSVRQPMVRNVGEALGVRALVNLKGPPEDLFKSTVEVKNIYEMENLLAGPQPFQGLRSPVWPENILGTIDREKAEQGAKHYKKYCQKCHLPPMDSPEISLPQYWTTPNEWDKSFLKVTMVNIWRIGTDPTEVINFYQRTADTGMPKLGVITAAIGLRVVTEKVAQRKYDELQLPAEERIEWDGYRENLVRAPLAYKARPLNGIWATAPYLHNGSVPNLYQLLLPAEQRDQRFYLGSKEFDPKPVGFETTKIEGGFELRTEMTGNSNAGHEFRNIFNGSSVKGVIGPELSDPERWELVEYLKTL